MTSRQLWLCVHPTYHACIRSTIGRACGGGQPRAVTERAKVACACSPSLVDGIIIDDDEEEEEDDDDDDDDDDEEEDDGRRVRARVKESRRLAPSLAPVGDFGAKM